MDRLLLCVVMLVAWPLPVCGAEEPLVLFHDDFNTLEAWQPLTFPKIKAHSEYAIEGEGSNRVLKATTHASASGLVCRRFLNINEYPVLRWRWKVSNVYKRGDATRKEGDDYPARVYVLFAYDPARSGFARKMEYLLAKAVYGEFPPHSTISYIWANRPHKQRILTNPYTSLAKMVVQQAGSEKAGTWIEEEVDVLADYRAAFGEDPPAKASLAIMSDSDDTGESATAWFDFIEVRKKE